MRHRNMVGLLDGEELLRMHEFLPTRGCNNCMDSGVEVRLIVDTQLQQVIGLAVGGECECCGGFGFHYVHHLS